MNLKKQKTKLTEKPPERLYKYKKFDEKTISLIVNSVIYFSKADQFNDPFDCRLRYSYEGTDAEWRAALTRSFQRYKPELSAGAVVAIVEENIRANAHRDINFLDERGDKNLRDQIERTSILCLTTDPKNILMWSHYAGDHRGCCLEFSTSTRIFDRAQIVKYRHKYPVSRLVDSFGVDDGDAHGELTIFTKSKLWEYEQEWRVFSADRFGLYKFDQESLTGIVFGYWMPKENKEMLRKLVDGRTPKIKLYQAVPKDRQFGMKLLPFT